MPFSLLESRKRVAGLVAAVFGLDLLWWALPWPQGSLAFGLIDLPAHLATTAVILAALAAARGWRPSPRFVAAALLASVAIDFDHVPGYLGSHGLAGSLPRPYTHSLVLVAGFLVLAGVTRRRGLREVALGFALGVSAHLLRDLATGPGVPLAWPLDSGIARIPYAVHGAALVFGLSVVVARQPRATRAWRLALPLVLLVAVVGTLAAMPSPAPAKAQGSYDARPTIGVGAYIPGAESEPERIDEFAQAVGRSPVIVSFYRNWGLPLLEGADLEAASSHGAVPMITWEPWTQSEQGVSLWSIAAGEQDSYLWSAAEEAAASGQPIFLRFAHEMNGDWYPWGWGIDGNVPATYKAAWRHVVTVFREAGASNVRWVWCPYVSNTRPRQFRRFYPGDQWVDWVGMDGFNWGSYRTWQSFGKIFAFTYRQLVRMTSRPIMIAETGANQSGGDKSRWIWRALHGVLPRYRHIRALVWFDADDRRGDFRVDSSAGSLATMRRALSGRSYDVTRESLLATPARLAPIDARAGGGRGGAR